MSSNTPRVSLYKPAGGENVSVTTDLNNNFDKIDTNLNFRVAANATARNAISPFWAGLNVRDTDTGKLYVSNGSAPISGSWQEIVQTNVRTTDELLLGNLTRGQRGSATDSVFEGRVAADVHARWFVRADGLMFWGTGAVGADTNLYRSAADTLKTDDSFVVGQDLTVGGNVVFSSTGAEKWSDNSSSTTVATSTTETVIATLAIPANDAVSGAVYRITAWGTAGVTATPTLTLRGKMGGVGGTTFGTTAFVASSGVVGKVWKTELYFVILTTGGSGTGFGNIHSFNGLTVAGGNPVTSPGNVMDGGSQITVDTTIARDLVLTAQWSASSASNTITCRGYAAERVS